MKSCVSCSHVGYDNVVSCFMLCGCLADVRRENNNQQKCKYFVSQLGDSGLGITMLFQNNHLAIVFMLDAFSLEFLC